MNANHKKISTTQENQSTIQHFALLSSLYITLTIFIIVKLQSQVQTSVWD